MKEGLILKVENLNVAFNKEKVLENLNFKVKEKEALAIIGPNGAGKTVLLRTLLNLIPYQGEIKWKKGIRVGYVPQALFPKKDLPLTVKEFFSFRISNSKRISLRETTEVLHSVGIEPSSVLKKKIGPVSSVQFQRILVAWALLADPQVLLFDEPVAGIDIGGQETIYSLLEKLQKEKGLTIILVSHDLNIIYRIANRVLCLNKRILCQGKPQEVLDPQYLAQLYGGEIKFYKHRH